MDDESFEDFWDWETEDDAEGYLRYLADELADRFFLSDNEFLPAELEDYDLGYLEHEDWWPLVNQLQAIVNLESLLRAAVILDNLLGLPGLPTELLEDPLAFLQTALRGHLPRLPSGRKVGTRKLVAIALAVVDLMWELPDVARAAVRAWADVHRRMLSPTDYDEYRDFEDADLTELLFPDELPLAMTGFSMMIALTLMRWPDRAEGLRLPPEFGDPEVYREVLERWEGLPNSPTAGEEGIGQAEALFTQGQLAHMLAQMGAVELLSTDEPREGEIDLAYSRLSRAMLWIYDQCRSCPAREEVACKAATGWPERPVPLLDVAGEISNTGRIAGCIKM
jgi:hypothetical protein